MTKISSVSVWENQSPDAALFQHVCEDIIPGLLPGMMF
jgi:hypothetical protein